MSRVVVGVDAGGTSTIAALAQDGRLVRTREGMAANASTRGVEAAAGTIADTILGALDGAVPEAIFVGAAGAGREETARSIEGILQSRFSGARVGVRDDACIALRAAVPAGDGLVVIAGTGSVAYAERAGIAYRAGGYGYLLGDEGSGFAIGSGAIRLLLRAFDERGPRDAFVEEIAARLEASSAMDVLAHVYGNPHAVTMIAGLAPIAIAAANRGDRSANKLLQNAALELAEMVKSLAKRSNLAQSGAPVVLSGGLLRENTLLTFLLETRLSHELPSMPVWKGDVEPYIGALAQAEQPVAMNDLPQTELANAQTRGLDTLSTGQLVRVLAQEQRAAFDAVLAVSDSIAEAVEEIAARMRAGGRLHYVGAGSSGRLGFLDASEMPPTFGTDPGLVCAHIAGGTAALTRAIEGAEDDCAAGEREMTDHVRRSDAVVGLSASGGAPYVLGAIRTARTAGAWTLGVANSRGSALVAAADLGIVLETGAEPLTGSTRLKAGTSQKLLLNTISTATMVRLGKVHGNLMVDVVATNAKPAGTRAAAGDATHGRKRAAGARTLASCGRQRQSRCRDGRPRPQGAASAQPAQATRGLLARLGYIVIRMTRLRAQRRNSWLLLPGSCGRSSSSCSRSGLPG